MAVRSAMHQAGAAALTELLQFPAPTADQQRGLSLRPASSLPGAAPQTSSHGGHTRKFRLGQTAIASLRFLQE